MKSILGKSFVVLACIVFAFGCSEKAEVEKSSESVEIDYERQDEAFLYTKAGELYSGELKRENPDSDSTYFMDTFEHGLRKHSIEFNNNEERLRSFDFNYDENGDLIGFTEYYADGSKKQEWLQGGVTEKSQGYTKMWYPNGQLEYEMQWDENNEYHGTMTQWDEEGNILKQEEYKNGELVQS